MGRGAIGGEGTRIICDEGLEAPALGSSNTKPLLGDLGWQYSCHLCNILPFIKSFDKHL